MNNIKFKTHGGAATLAYPGVGHAQKGATLLITVIVLFALTVIAIAAANSNQSQSIMVRNNQFRLEAFNTSYAEVDGQIDFINKRTISAGVPDHVIALIDGAVGGKVSDDQVDPRDLAFYSKNPTDMDKSVSQRYNGRCLVFGQQIGVGAEKLRCHELEINADTKLNNTSVGSQQHQVYEYKTLN